MVQMNQKFQTPESFHSLDGCQVPDWHLWLFRQPHLKSFSVHHGGLGDWPLTHSIAVSGLVSICLEMMVTLGF